MNNAENYAEVTLKKPEDDTRLILRAYCSLNETPNFQPKEILGGMWLRCSVQRNPIRSPCQPKFFTVHTNDNVQKPVPLWFSYQLF